MKRLRLYLAILAGLSFAVGYVASSGKHLELHRILFGLMWATVTPFVMMNEPDRVANKATLILMVLLLVGLNIVVGMTESRARLAFSLVWTTIYCGALFGFARLRWKELRDLKQDDAPPDP